MIKKDLNIFQNSNTMNSLLFLSNIVLSYQTFAHTRQNCDSPQYLTSYADKPKSNDELARNVNLTSQEIMNMNSQQEQSTLNSGQEQVYLNLEQSSYLFAKQF